MSDLRTFVLICFILILCHSVTSFTTKKYDHGAYDLDIRMPHVVSEKADKLMCTGVRLKPEEAYIVKFTPHASKTTAHHMMVYGCKAPANHNTAWACELTDSYKSDHSVCADGEERQILFAWALDAPAKALPKGVGLRIAGSTGIKYIIIQLHYARKFEDGETDNSGVTLHVTRARPSQQMGYYVLGSAQTIPPQQTDAHLETACEYSSEYPIYPIGFRTHSHNLGVVTSGYRIRDGRWTEIGRMSPQLPQTFYNITNPGMDIRKGDVVAARCTMNSMTRKDPTRMGPTNHDEMCNFYIMYSTRDQKNLLTSYCFPQNTKFTWARDLHEYLPPPSNASSLQGIPNADYVRGKFNMTKH